MANIIERFTGADGSAPSGTSTVAAGGSVTVQSNRLSINTTTGPYLTNRNSRPGVANGDLIVDITVGSVAENYPEVLVRADSTTTYGVGYSVLLQPAASLIEIDEWAASDNTALASAAFTYTAATVYRVRFQFIGSLLQCKIWDPTGAEPGSWMVSTTDVSTTAAGNIHLAATSGAASTSITTAFDDLVVFDLDAPVPAAVQPSTSRRRAANF